MIGKNISIILMCTFLLFNSSCSWGIGLPEGKITLKVIDEDGNPIENANIGIGFERNTGSGTEKEPKNGKSDKQGNFTGAARTINYASYIVDKDGYYQSYGEYRFKNHESGKWQPWNPEIKVVMRKIEKPVPMYAKDLKMEHPEILIPAVGKDIGFDLVECDWVAPYGKGKHSDFIFKLVKTITDINNYDSKLTITFPNKFDGIQIVKDNRKGGSIFKLPRYASEEGYQNKLIRFLNRHGVGAPESDFSDDNNYIFRIRSEEKDGKLIRAMYGKIHGDIRFYPGDSKTASLGFKYFLNPDYTRNLEYGENFFLGVQVGID